MFDEDLSLLYTDYGYDNISIFLISLSLLFLVIENLVKSIENIYCYSVSDWKKKNIPMYHKWQSVVNSEKLSKNSRNSFIISYVLRTFRTFSYKSCNFFTKLLLFTNESHVPNQNIFFMCYAIWATSRVTVRITIVVAGIHSFFISM